MLLCDRVLEVMLTGDGGLRATELPADSARQVPDERRLDIGKLQLVEAQSDRVVTVLEDNMVVALSDSGLINPTVSVHALFLGADVKSVKHGLNRNPNHKKSPPVSPPVPQLVGGISPVTPLLSKLSVPLDIAFVVLSVSFPFYTVLYPLLVVCGELFCSRSIDSSLHAIARSQATRGYRTFQEGAWNLVSFSDSSSIREATRSDSILIILELGESTVACWADPRIMWLRSRSCSRAYRIYVYLYFTSLGTRFTLLYLNQY
jgi:hypothetical protein